MADGTFAKMNKKPCYQLPDGEVLSRRQTNRHHIIFPEQRYKGRLERFEYRELSGFIIRMSIPIHKELHANVRPPIKPSNNTIRAIIAYSQLLDASSSPYENFLDIKSYVNHLSEYAKSDRIREESNKLHFSLTEQDYFISQGRVDEYYGTSQ